MRSFNKIGAAIGLLLVLGCSGGSGSSTSSAPPPPPPPPPPMAPSVAAPSVSSPRSTPKSSVKPKVKLAATEQPNLYTVGVPAPNFTAQRPQLRRNESLYAAASPTAGTSTSQFVTSPPSRPQPRTQVNPAFEVPEGFEIIADGGFDEQGIPRRLRCTLDGAEMAFVPGGAFLQGIDGHAHDVGPQHAVFVDGFYMDILEVTLEQYLRFRTATLTTRRPAQPVNPFDPPEFPALGISWRDAQNYAKWAGKELPTEAEWERAGRGTEGFHFPWGNGRPIWEHDRRPGQTDPVGSHSNDRSIYGILDLAGNAREWCSDWYAEDTYLQARTADGSPPRNPIGPERPTLPNARVLKGAGSDGWQLWARSYAAMKEMLPDVGVRCVLRVQLPAEDAAAAPVAN